jgi:predicted nucleic acid-binding protein
VRVILDTCVLVPVIIRELLIRLGSEKYITPLWSKQILKEWQGVFNKRNLEMAAQTQIEILLLTAKFPGSNIVVDDMLEKSLFLPDLEDRHVLAAAINGQADLIITQNIKDFPYRILSEFNVKVQIPDKFFVEVFNDNPILINKITRKLFDEISEKNPKIKELKKLLKKAGLTRLAKRFSD